MFYLTTRGDSSVKGSQPLVIFGINSGSLNEQRKLKMLDMSSVQTCKMSVQ